MLKRYYQKMKIENAKEKVQGAGCGGVVTSSAYWGPKGVSKPHKALSS